MAIEIERKFLVRSDGWRLCALRSVAMEQGYMSRGEGVTLRIRRADERYVLTLKAGIDAHSRYEFEYEVPAADGRIMLEKLCRRPPLRKRRYYVEDGRALWELDIFEGENAGLMIAEIELANWDQPFARPEWLGPEVTDDPRFFNAYLYRCPFQGWGVGYDDLLWEKAEDAGAGG